MTTAIVMLIKQDHTLFGRSIGVWSPLVSMVGNGAAKCLGVYPLPKTSREAAAKSIGCLPDTAPRKNRFYFIARFNERRFTLTCGVKNIHPWMLDSEQRFPCPRPLVKVWRQPLISPLATLYTLADITGYKYRQCEKGCATTDQLYQKLHHALYAWSSVGAWLTAAAQHQTLSATRFHLNRIWGYLFYREGAMTATNGPPTALVFYAQLIVATICSRHATGAHVERTSADGRRSHAARGKDDLLQLLVKLSAVISTTVPRSLKRVNMPAVDQQSLQDLLPLLADRILSLTCDQKLWPSGLLSKNSEVLRASRHPLSLSL